MGDSAESGISVPLCSKKHDLAPELLSGRSLGALKSPAEELLITLRVATEHKGPGDASTATGLIPRDRSTDSTCDNKYIFLDFASPVQEVYPNWAHTHTHTGFCNAACKSFFSDSRLRLNHGVLQ